MQSRLLVMIRWPVSASQFAYFERSEFLEPNICQQEREKKHDYQLAVDESMVSLGSLWVFRVPTGLSIAQCKGCWAECSQCQGWSDLRCPHAQQFNHSGEILWKQGQEDQEVLQCYVRDFICLVLQFPSFNPQRFWTLSSVKIFLFRKSSAHCSLLQQTAHQENLFILLSESSISCSILSRGRVALEGISGLI